MKNTYINRKIFKVLNIENLVIVLFIVITSSGPLRDSNIIYFSSAFAVFLLLILQNLKFGIKFNYYFRWLFLFYIYLFSSVLWSMDLRYPIQGIITGTVILIVNQYYNTILKTKKDIFVLMDLYIIAQLIVVLYIFSKIDFSLVGIERIGATILGDSWNANDIGTNFSYAALLSYFFMNNGKGKSSIKYKIFTYMFIILVFLTGSKKSMLNIVLSFGTYYLLASEKNKLMKRLRMIFVLLLLLYITFNIPLFYNVIGSRIQTFTNYFTGRGHVDSSTRQRMQMIKFGFELIDSKFFLGYGLNNYRVLYGNRFGTVVYSHNNYIEILVGLGLIGLILYYRAYFKIFFNSLRKINNLSALSISIMVSIFIADLASVSYQIFTVQLMILIAYKVNEFSKYK